MLKNWMKILPFFVVEWFAKTRCEYFRLEVEGSICTYASPFKGCLFRIPRWPQVKGVDGNK